MLTQMILTATEGVLTPREFAFAGQQQVVVGRSEGCSLRLDDPAVSRRHCLLEIGGEGAWVWDLGSLNGTFVNGRLVGQRPGGEPNSRSRRGCRELHDRDVMRLGGNAFRVTLEAYPAEESAGSYEPELCAGCI